MFSNFIGGGNVDVAEYYAAEDRTVRIGVLGHEDYANGRIIPVSVLVIVVRIHRRGERSEHRVRCQREDEWRREEEERGRGGGRGSGGRGAEERRSRGAGEQRSRGTAASHEIRNTG